MEYVNRLIGLGVGVLMLATGLSSISYLGTSRYMLFWLSLAAGLGIVVAALLGALVVATHLLPFAVTLHMLTAFFIIAALLAALHRHRAVDRVPQLITTPGLWVWIWSLGAVFLIQVLLGTQLREEVDRLLLTQTPTSELLKQSGAAFYLHRAAAWGVLLGQLLFCYWLTRRKTAGQLQNLAYATAATYVTTAGVGASLYYFDLPAALQPLHLLLAFIAFGLQTQLILRCTRSSSYTLP